MDQFCGRAAHQAGDDDTGPWMFTGAMRDRARFDGQCPWCDRRELRITFEVRQGAGGEAFNICAACLGHGPARVACEGRGLDGQERRDHLSELAVRLMHRTCRDVVRNLLAGSDDPALREVAVYFDRNVQLSPSRAATLLLALSQSKLDADPRIFEVQIRSIAHKEEFGRLGEPEKLAVWPVLSAAIRRRLAAMGLAPARFGAPRPAGTRPRNIMVPALL